MSTGKILFISNGIGEDTIAAGIIEHLKQKMNVEDILAFPLVGEGDPYLKTEVQIVAPVKTLPSGGLIPSGYVSNVMKDIFAGLLSLSASQIFRLSSLKKHISLVVAVGDTVPVILGGMFVKKPVIFIGTAKSNYFVPYSGFERSFFKKYCDIIFPRDEPTAENLRSHGLNARWVGNAMMDCLTYTNERFSIPEGRTIITLLFGSRDVAYKDIPIMLEAARLITQMSSNSVTFISPIANTIQRSFFENSVVTMGYKFDWNQRPEGVAGKISKSFLEVILLKNRFGTALNLAKVVIGQAGTGNEQAAGLGKPVIAFDSGRRNKLGWYRARQKGLLGNALAVVPAYPCLLYTSPSPRDS